MYPWGDYSPKPMQLARQTPRARTRPRFQWLLFFLLAMALGCHPASAQSQRTRTLLDPGWKFNLGDPPDVGSAVPYYPEISNLAKLETNELSGTDSEAYLETIRVDPVATGMGETVSFVQPTYNDSGWTQVNLPYDWIVGLPFSSKETRTTATNP